MGRGLWGVVGRVGRRGGELVGVLVVSQVVEVVVRVQASWWQGTGAASFAVGAWWPMGGAVRWPWAAAPSG